MKQLELRESSARSTFPRWRQGLMICCCLAVVSLLSFRAIHLHVFASEEYRALAERNQFFSQFVQPERGIILDRYNDPLVWNVQQYTLLDNPDQVYTSAHPISREEAMSYMATESGKVAATTRRQYRYSSLANTVGYIAPVTAEELLQKKNVRVGQFTGKTGLEWMYENILRGQPGENTYEVDALGKKQRLVSSRSPANGKNIETTLDPYLTEVAATEFGTHTGAVIVVDASNGDVLALTSQPGFDPNVFSQEASDPDAEAARRAKVQDIFLDERKLLFNRAISGAYPPGSVFKIVTALSGLENKKIDNSTTVLDEGVLKVGEFEYRNWYFSQYGRVEGEINLTRAIARSNDTFFYKLAEWVGPDPLAETAREYSFGEKSGIDLPAETRGLVPDTAWKEKIRGEKWFLGNTYHYGIGQGDLLTSPIQLAQMAQAVANNGELCRVRVSKEQSKSCRQTVASNEDRQLVLQGMIGACSAGGTAFPFFPWNTAVMQPEDDTTTAMSKGAVACKTGTAEFGAADGRGYRKTHGWLTAIVELPETVPSVVNANHFLPSELSLHDRWKAAQTKSPFPRKIVITVLVESDQAQPYQEGSRDAGPIAQKIVEWLMLK